MKKAKHMLLTLLIVIMSAGILTGCDSGNSSQYAKAEYWAYCENELRLDMKM